MTLYELLTLLASIVAIVISAVSLVRTRKLAAEQFELEKITAELSRLQIKGIEEQESQKTQPHLNVAITRLGNSTHFIISNTGKGIAYKVNLELVDCEDNPLTGQVDHVLPYAEMRPASRIKLLAGMHMGSPLKYQVRLIWQDSSGKEFSEIHWVSR